jgi:predicted nucleic acid-binding protein
MICFDANVLIEIILERKNAKACRQYIDSAQADMTTTMLSLDLVLYYTERNKLTIEPIEQFLRLFTWLPLTDSDADWAFRHFNGKDFEDALQVACATREGCNRFVTLDRRLTKKYAQEIPIDFLG